MGENTLLHAKLDKDALITLVQGTVPKTSQLSLDWLGSKGQLYPGGNNWQWDLNQLSRMTEQELWRLYCNLRNWNIEAH